MGALSFITALMRHLAGSFILTDSFVYSSKTQRLSKLAENTHYRFGSNTPYSIFTLVSWWLPTNSFWPDTAKRGTTLQSHYTQTLQCAVSCFKQSADLNYKYKRMELYCPYYSLSTQSTKFQYKYKRRERFCPSYSLKIKSAGVSFKYKKGTLFSILLTHWKHNRQIYTSNTKKGTSLSSVFVENNQQTYISSTKR